MKYYTIHCTATKRFEVVSGLNPFSEKNRKNFEDLGSVIDFLKNEGIEKRKAGIRINMDISEEARKELGERIRKLSAKAEIVYENFGFQRYRGSE